MSSTLAPAVGFKSTTWKHLGNGFNDPVSGVSVIARMAFLCSGSKDNVPSDLIKSCPEMAGDMTVRPMDSGLVSSLESNNKILGKNTLQSQFCFTLSFLFFTLVKLLLIHDIFYCDLNLFSS